MTTKDVVTTHAILRWLERIRGLSPATIAARLPANPSDHRLANEGCRMIGLTVRQAEAIICPPLSRAAVLAGAKSVRGPEFTLCCRDGVVVTIVFGKPQAVRGYKSPVGSFRLGKPSERRVRTDLRGMMSGAAE